VARSRLTGAIETMLEEAGRFAHEVVAPLVEHPEQVLPAAQLEALTGQAAEVGLLPAGPEDDGLWGQAEGRTGFSLDALRLLAEVNGGVAFHLHRLALATRLRARLGLPGSSTAVAVALQGHYGLGRQALPRLLAGRPLDGADIALLADYFDLARHARVVVGGPWQTLIVAGFDGTHILWQEVARTQCAVEARPHSHGFDELQTSTVRRTATAVPAGTADTAAYTEAFYLDSLGMTAIAAGLVDRGLDLARAYAGQRRQGGVLVETFPAVAQMLGQISATARTATQQLAWFKEQDPAGEALAGLCAVRSTFHPACCVATNNAMQVFAGRGYMQDFGVEKLVRDANALRVLGGTPVELGLFVAEWERAR